MYFDQQLALDHDNAQLISFNHAYMKKGLMRRLEETAYLSNG